MGDKNNTESGETIQRADFRQKKSIMVKLYFNDISPPARACLAFLKMLKIEHEVHAFDLLKREHKADWYLEINPIGQVPFLQDGDFKIPESRAILTYLFNKYAAGKPELAHMYPTEPEARAKVDVKLYWSISFHNANVPAVVVPCLFKTPTDPEKIKETANKLKELTEMVKDHDLKNFDLADILNGYYLTIAFQMGKESFKYADYPELEKFWKAISADENFAAANQGWNEWLPNFLAVKL